MIGLNDRWFVFYWRASDKDPWTVSQPITMGELIDGNVELNLSDGGSLPMNDINWPNDQIMYENVPSRERKEKK